MTVRARRDVRGMGRPSPAYRPKTPAQRVLIRSFAILDLRHRWADGTTQLLFEPVELLARLAALTPRPRINLLLYYGVLGARSAWRSRLRAREPDTPIVPGQAPTAVASSSHAAAAIPPRTNCLWAALMQRSFGFDPGSPARGLCALGGGVLACPRCGDRLELIALIEDPKVIRRILSHLGLPTGVPAARPARPPPLPIGRSDPWSDADDVMAP